MIQKSKIIFPPLIFSISATQQNVAKKLGISYKPLLYTGIKYSGQWINYCSGCNSVYQSTDDVCKNCGNPLKRKLQRRHP